MFGLWSPERGYWGGEHVLSLAVVTSQKTGYCEEIRVFKAGYRLNTLAWDNGRASDFVG